MSDLEAIAQSLARLEAWAARADERFDRLEAWAARADERFDRLEAWTARADERFDRLEAWTARADERLDRLEAHADRTDERLDHIEANMATKMDLAQARASLEEGQSLILKVVRGHTDQLAVIPAALSELNRRVTTIETRAE